MPKGPPQLVDTHLLNIDEDQLWIFIKELTGDQNERVRYLYFYFLPLCLLNINFLVENLKL